VLVTSQGGGAKIINYFTFDGGPTAQVYFYGFDGGFLGTMQPPDFHRRKISVLSHAICFHLVANSFIHHLGGVAKGMEA
jgi:hypothetical protein